MLSQEKKQQLRQEKKEKIIRIRKTLSEMTEEQRQAVANKFGIVTVEGHLLTSHNQCFLVAQSEISFSIVGGFQQWKKAGRIVRKGEHGFLIFVPSKAKQENNSEMISDDEDVHFFTATVFDISQTEILAADESNKNPGVE
ncbi:MAG: ArdC family protein [Bacteroidetes bacterium]|nr:ArdC family protein [Bacteroidota bacterium]MCL5028878.1 ArdC family protein [Bacteroidota bacterium]